MKKTVLALFSLCVFTSLKAQNKEWNIVETAEDRANFAKAFILPENLNRDSILNRISSDFDIGIYRDGLKNEIPGNEELYGQFLYRSKMPASFEEIMSSAICGVIVEPSFTTPYCLAFEMNDKDASIMELSFWGDSTKHFMAIDDSLFHNLEKLIGLAIRTAVGIQGTDDSVYTSSQSTARVLDGIHYYYFNNSGLCAQTHSPGKGTYCWMLTQITNALSNAILLHDNEIIKSIDTRLHSSISYFEHCSNH
ncbi:MAG: hypothetical protein MJY66_08160 [Bacteroidaceae bacterium]|nr:hypothetical protein [Bacteroidaceae bacterium]